MDTPLTDHALGQNLPRDVLGVIMSHMEKNARKMIERELGMPIRIAMVVLQHNETRWCRMCHRYEIAESLTTFDGEEKFHDDIDFHYCWCCENDFCSQCVARNTFSDSACKRCQFTDKCRSCASECVRNIHCGRCKESVCKTYLVYDRQLCGMCTLRDMDSTGVFSEPSTNPFAHDILPLLEYISHDRLPRWREVLRPA